MTQISCQWPCWRAFYMKNKTLQARINKGARKGMGAPPNIMFDAILTYEEYEVLQKRFVRL